MKTWISILAGTIMLCALPTHAAAPDYVGFSRKIDAISAFLVSGEMCTSVGYTIAPGALEETTTPASQATRDGIPESAADGMVKASLQAAKARELTPLREYAAKAQAAAGAHDDKTLFDVSKDYFYQIDTRCRGFAESPEFGPLITAPAGEVFDRYVKWMKAKFTGS